MTATAPALCFDAYGTLCDTSSVTGTLRAELGIPAGFAADIDDRWRRKQLQYANQLSQMGQYKPFWEVTRDALEYALAYYDCASDADADTRGRILAAYDGLDPYPDAERALSELADEGDRPLAVLSNGNPEMLSRLVENAGLDAYFDAIVSAEGAGVFKPDPAVYEHAAARLDRPLEECRLVSSNAWDVAGASAAGMRTAWVDRSGEPAECIGGEADLVVESLSGLAGSLPLGGGDVADGQQ